MNFITVNADKFGEIYQKMKSAFPYEERRDEDRQINCFTDPRYRLKEIETDGARVGFVSYWEYPETVFIEHFAIDEKHRGKGYGTAFLRSFVKYCPKNVILEVEPPETSVYAKRRVGFYRRFGFFLNGGTDYAQPSYHGGGKIPLVLMSYPALLSENEISAFIALTYGSCYKNL
jgi:GNAT superfamily N-acetyltransferase